MKDHELFFNLGKVESFPPHSLGGYGGKRTRQAMCVILSTKCPNLKC